MDNQIFQAVNKLMKINREHKYIIDSQVAEIGLHRTGHRILMYIARRGYLPSQKELAEYLDVTPAAVSGALQKLECDGYIERNLGIDNRFNEVTITEKGRDIVEKTRVAFSEVDNRLFNNFSDDEISDFLDYLERILKNIKGENSNEKMG